MSTPQFSEAFLHYIWKFRLFDQSALQTTDGELLVIKKTGMHNHFSGPDFKNAGIYIGSVFWAGEVEIHKRSSDWWRHQHQTDKAYDQVILHVVFEHDKAVYRSDGSHIPTVVLKGRIDPMIFEEMDRWLSSDNAIPCATQLTEIAPELLHIWLQRVAIERLEDKSKSIQKLLENSKNDWEAVFLLLLGRSFGLHTNTTAFEQLLRSIPKLITPINHNIWNFRRVRPSAFPTIRIVLFAALLHQSNHLFRQLLESKTLDNLEEALNVNASEYWQNHYQLEKKSARKQSKRLGKTSFQRIVINTFIPLLFVYGKMMDESSYSERALEWLTELPKEKNRLVATWEEWGVTIENALESQALIQLQKKYCEAKHCLSCGIGYQLLKRAF